MQIGCQLLVYDCQNEYLSANQRRNTLNDNEKFFVLQESFATTLGHGSAHKTHYKGAFSSVTHYSKAQALNRRAEK
jgi:hypothetical protein